MPLANSISGAESKAPEEPDSGAMGAQSRRDQLFRGKSSESVDVQFADANHWFRHSARPGKSSNRSLETPSTMLSSLTIAAEEEAKLE